MLAGCTNRISPSAADAPVATNEGAAWVVVGYGAETVPTWATRLWQDCDKVDTKWLRVLPEKEIFGNLGFEISGPGCSKSGNPVKYYIFNIPPGGYALDSVVVYNGGLAFTYHNKVLEVDRYDQMKTVKFTAASGEIIYIGDIVYTKMRPPVASLRRNDAAVANFLKGRLPEGKTFSFRSLLPDGRTYSPGAMFAVR